MFQPCRRAAEGPGDAEEERRVGENGSIACEQETIGRRSRDETADERHLEVGASAREIPAGPGSRSGSYGSKSRDRREQEGGGVVEMNGDPSRPGRLTCRSSFSTTDFLSPVRPAPTPRPHGNSFGAPPVQSSRE